MMPTPTPTARRPPRRPPALADGSKTHHHQHRRRHDHRHPATRCSSSRSRPSSSREDSGLRLDPIDEVKLWVDANLAKNLGGGVANTSRGAGGRLFAKIARGRAKNDMFRGEFLGLNAIVSVS